MFHHALETPFVFLYVSSLLITMLFHLNEYHFAVNEQQKGVVNSQLQIMQFSISHWFNGDRLSVIIPALVLMEMMRQMSLSI